MHPLLIPRGIRNNNPGNIRLGKTRFDGQKMLQTDMQFIEFEDPVMGIRALMRVLLTYHVKYALDTVAAVINRWAPPHENDTELYIRDVAAKLAVKPTAIINNFSGAEKLTALSAAIICHENGTPPEGADPACDRAFPENWYAPETYAGAAQLALSSSLLPPKN